MSGIYSRKKVKIGDRWIGDGEPAFIVFEGGATHTGLESAIEMVDNAKSSGADAIKFQTVFADKLMSRQSVQFQYESATGAQSEGLAEILKRREMPYADWAKLKAHADEVGMLFFSTPDSPESIDFLAEIGSPCIKIAGGDMNNYPLIRHAALTGLPILLDTRGTLAELEQAINTCVHANNDQIVIVHCPSGYPSPLDSVRLNMVPLYLNTFHYPVGFSDHSPDIDMNIAALCLGAHFIEKTITLDRNIQSVEHVMSLELGEMAAFVQRLRDVEHALGSPWTWSMSSEEKEALKKTRRSVVLTSDSKEGETITAGMIDYKRPGYSISPEMTNMIIGKRLKKDKPADVPLDWEDLSDAV